MGPPLHLRTAAWYGDRPLDLAFPAEWEVTVASPRTPPPLTDADIVQRLEHPVGQPPIRELARGRSRPLIIVDDLTRPTPVGRIMPFVLRQFEQAGVRLSDIRILMATGAHGAPPVEALVRKVGPDAGRACRLLVHNHRRGLIRAGQTSFGTPVVVNREVMASDLVIGVSGIYPQHTTGFGGGSKLALGVLGRRSIIGLHYGHPSMGGSYETENAFRRDLAEIARMIGLNTMVSAHVDMNRDIVRLVSGDHHAYYADTVSFSRSTYLVPLPGTANVVVSNAYPIDVSLTFMRSKGMTPLFHAEPGASRVLIAACSEGIGYHGLFPFVNGPRFEPQIHRLRRLMVMDKRTIPSKVVRRLVRRLRRPAPRATPAATSAFAVAPPRRPLNPIWLYPPGRSPGSLPSQIPGMTAVFDWSQTLDRVQAEQAGNDRVTVLVYPCAPLQVLDLGSGRHQDVSPEAMAISD